MGKNLCLRKFVILYQFVSIHFLLPHYVIIIIIFWTYIFLVYILEPAVGPWTKVDTLSQ